MRVLDFKFDRRLFYLTLCVIFVAVASSCKSSKRAYKDDVASKDIIVLPHGKHKKDQKKSSLEKKLVAEAHTWIGTPYAYARQDKGVATDCSGMVMCIYRDVANIKLPRNSAQQADFCDDLKEKEVTAGDLVFFATGKDKNRISHVGIMIDRVKFIHASASKGVIISEMTTPYYIRTFKRYGRVPR